MEEHQKRHITHHFWDLVRLTDCNTTCTSILRQNNVLSDEDKSELDSIQNTLKKTEKLYDLLLTKKDSYSHLTTALTESCQTGALAILNQLGEQTESTTSVGALNIGPKRRKNDKDPIIFDVLSPVFNFTGREPQLIALHQKLQEYDGKRAVISQIASIVGLGGIGKTELARKYIQKYVQEFYDGNAVWISAENEERLSSSFRMLAEKLNISQSNVDKIKTDLKTIVDRVYTYFNDQRVLIVFDNAESTDYLQMFMPLHLSSSSTSPHILITSRDREWSFSTEVLELDVMTEKDAICFVQKCLQNEKDAQVLKLVNRLQRYPLALSQSVSYIKQRQFLGSFTISQYLDKFEENLENLLNTKRPKAEFNTYKETTRTTWRVTTEQISDYEENGRLAINILNSIAYFLPDNIPMDLFSHLSNGKEYQNAVFLLVKYSMINVQGEEKTISVHRLVQDVTRMQLKQNKLEEFILRNAMKCFLGDIEFKNVNHACSVFKFCGGYKSVIVEFKAVPWSIITTFETHGGSSSALNIAAELKEILLKYVSSEDVDFLRLESRVVDLELQLEGLESTLNTLQKILPLFRENKTGLFSENEIIVTLQQYARILQKLGRRSESLEIWLESYKKLKALKGLNAFESIDVLVAIANCLYEIGHFKEPPPLDVEYLQILSEEFMTADPQKITSVFKTAYENNKHMMDDYNYANALFGAAQCLRKLGDEDTASYITREIYERGKQSKDFRNQTIAASCLNLLAIFKDKEGKYEEAFEMYQEVLAFKSSAHGTTHMDTLKTKWNVLLTQRDLGQNEAALGGLRDVLKTMLTYYPDSTLTAGLNLDIAVTLYKLKRYDESYASFVDLKAKLQESFPHLEALMVSVNRWIEGVQNVMSG